MTDIFSSPPFYTTYIQFPTGNSTPAKIQQNPKFFPYFRDAIGAIDGSHIPVTPPALFCPLYRNRKGFLSQNALFACDFNLNFTYALTGWEGSASDARVYGDAIGTDLPIPAGKYLLADAGFPQELGLLVPYRGVRYHLAEWGRSSTRYVFLFSSHSLRLTLYQPSKQERTLQLAPFVRPERSRTHFWDLEATLSYPTTSDRVFYRNTG